MTVAGMSNPSTSSVDVSKSLCSETKSRILQARTDRALRAERAQRRAKRGADGLPPASNTGGKSPTGLHRGQITTIDTLTFSFELAALGTTPALVMHDDEAIASAITELFLNHFDMEVGQATGKRVNGYHDSAPIRFAGFEPVEKADIDAVTQELKDARSGQHGPVCPLQVQEIAERRDRLMAKARQYHQAVAGYVAWGGNCNKDGNDTVVVHLTGQGCESVNLLDASGEANCWELLADVMIQHNCKITRLDIAYDDLDGEYGGIGAAVGWYRQGGFTNGGRPPSVNQVGDWINGHGRTLYVGKRENGKMLRVYEKGHQLGDDADPWTRYELELHSRDRVIPIASLLYPDEILAGSYPALEFILECRPVSIPTVVRRKLQVTLDHLKKYARIGYGRLVNVMLALSPDDPSAVISDLIRDGLPRRLVVPPAACV